MQTLVQNAHGLIENAHVQTNQLRADVSTASSVACTAHFSHGNSAIFQQSGCPRVDPNRQTTLAEPPIGLLGCMEGTLLLYRFTRCRVAASRMWHVSYWLDSRLACAHAHSGREWNSPALRAGRHGSLIEQRCQRFLLCRVANRLDRGWFTDYLGEAKNRLLRALCDLPSDHDIAYRILHE